MGEVVQPYVADRGVTINSDNIHFDIQSLGDSNAGYAPSKFWFDTYRNQALVWFDVSKTRPKGDTDTDNVYGYIHPDTARMIAYALLELADVADGARITREKVKP